MKTTDQKLIALLERMGWKYLPDSEGDFLYKNGEQRSIPAITHELTDEVWEWMKKYDNNVVHGYYSSALIEVCRQIEKSEDIPVAVLIAHLTPHQKFEAAYAALGIE